MNSGNACFITCSMSHQVTLAHGTYEGNGLFPWSSTEFGYQPAFVLTEQTTTGTWAQDAVAYGGGHTFLCATLEDTTTSKEFLECAEPWNRNGNICATAPLVNGNPQPAYQCVIPADFADPVNGQVGAADAFIEMQPAASYLSPIGATEAFGGSPIGGSYGFSQSPQQVEAMVGAMDANGAGIGTDPTRYELINLQQGTECWRLTSCADSESGLTALTSYVPQQYQAYLGDNQALFADQPLISASGAYTAWMQDDGNLVVYGPSGAIWSSGTHGYRGADLVNQPDGNLVLYAQGRPIWWTGTSGGNNVLVMQNDGNLVLYNTNNGHALWSSYTGYIQPNAARARSRVRFVLSCGAPALPMRSATAMVQDMARSSASPPKSRSVLAGLMLHATARRRIQSSSGCEPPWVRRAIRKHLIGALRPAQHTFRP